MARYGKPKTTSTLEAKPEAAAAEEDAPFPRHPTFYRRVSKSRTARTISVTAMVKDDWDHVRIDVRPHGRSQYVWTVTPLLDTPEQLSKDNAA